MDAEESEMTTNWEKCCWFQEIKNEVLVQPSPKAINLGSGYITIAENTAKFCNLQVLPMSSESI